ncbi:MAG: DnaJ domain-containing protein [Myxococcaceae bacterium]
MTPAGARPPNAPGKPGAAIAPPAPGTPDTDLDGDALLSLDARYEALERSDYFEILQITKESSPAEIKKAFYRESRSLHPDRFYHLTDKALKERVNELYKRITEAYYVLRDDTKRKTYLKDVTGPERDKKLRFTEASEAEVKQAAKKEVEEQIGTHPKARGFYTTAMQDMDAERWQSAARNLKMALTYEPSNARYKEKLAEAEKKLEGTRDKNDAFKIK